MGDLEAYRQLYALYLAGWKGPGFRASRRTLYCNFRVRRDIACNGKVMKYVKYFSAFDMRDEAVGGRNYCNDCYVHPIQFLLQLGGDRTQKARTNRNIHDTICFAFNHKATDRVPINSIELTAISSQERTSGVPNVTFYFPHVASHGVDRFQPSQTFDDRATFP